MENKYSPRSLEGSKEKLYCEKGEKRKSDDAVILEKVVEWDISSNGVMELELELSRLIKQDKSKAITYFNFFESFIFYYTWSLRVFEAKFFIG